jgi:hypothetical protein
MWEKSFYDLSAVAARQQGLVTAGQATRVGVADEALTRFEEAGLLMELDWQVYQLASSALGPRYAYPYAAWLAISPEAFAWERPEGAADAVLSHESACQLHGMGSVAAPFMVFTAPRALAEPRATRIHVAELGDDEVMNHGGVRVTTPRRTVVDLVRDHTEHGDMRKVLTDAVQRDVVDVADVHADLVPFADSHAFPAGGPEFVHYFLPDLMPERLSLRNLRGYAALLLPHEVAKVQEELPVAADAADGALSRDIAAEIVGRTRWPRS